MFPDDMGLLAKVMRPNNTILRRKERAQAARILCRGRQTLVYAATMRRSWADNR